MNTSSKNKGIICIIFAAFFFSMMTLLARMSGELPSIQKAFFRNIVASFLGLVLLLRLWKREGPSALKITLPQFRDLFYRAGFGTIGLVLNFYAIDRIPLSDSNMLNKLSPFFAMLFSIYLLKEKVSKKEWFLVLVAFLGAILVIKPSFQMDSLYSLAGAASGLFAGLAYVFVRRLGLTGVKGPVIVTFFSVFSCLAILPFLILGYTPMTTQQILLLTCTGICASGGQLCITAAYSYCPAKEISVFDYSQVVFSAILGFFFLGQLADGWSFVGYALIIGAAIYKWNVGRKKG